EFASRLEALAEKVDALSGTAGRGTADTSRLADAVAAVTEQLRAVDARGELMQRGQQGIEDGLTMLARLAEREELFSDVQEQQRALRQRIEEGMSGLSERLALLETAHDTDTEGQRLLQVQLGALRQRLEVVATRVAGQGDVLLEHVRGMTTAAEDA